MTATATIKSKKIEQQFNKVLFWLSDKEREVIERRVGLLGEKETLQNIGNSFTPPITRERVRQLEEKEGFIENKIMGIQNNNGFFFNKGGEQNFNKDLEKNIIDVVNKKYKELLLELNYLKN